VLILARSWTNVAFFGHEGVREVSFGVRVPNIFSVEWQFSRQMFEGWRTSVVPVARCASLHFSVSREAETVLCLI
jgi:hypothetical protein